jgi:hypothetical protein
MPHDLEVIRPDIRDDPYGGTHHRALGHILQMGLQRHAFDYNGSGVFSGGGSDESDLLLYAGRASAPDAGGPAVGQNDLGMVAGGLGAGADSGAAQKLRGQAGHGGLAPGAVDVNAQRGLAQAALMKLLLQNQITHSHRKQNQIDHLTQSRGGGS